MSLFRRVREKTFETAVERRGEDEGLPRRVSFGRGAYEEVARVKAAKGLDIVLLTVADLLRQPDLVTPQPGLLLPLPGGTTP